MKRLGMICWAVCGCLLISGAPAWAQSLTVIAARQQAEEAAARARSEDVLARTRAEAARQDAGIPVAPNVTTVPKKAVAAGAGLAPGVTVVTPSAFGNQWSGSVQWSTRSSDPLSSLQVAPGTWWNNAETAARLNLTKDQQKKMDDIFQQFRLTLIDLNASLSKEELIMAPLIGAERLDEVKILAQIDKIAQARAELEKANSRMLLAIRQSLTMEQWTKIESSPAYFRVVSPRK